MWPDTLLRMFLDCPSMTLSTRLTFRKWRQPSEIVSRQAQGRKPMLILLTQCESRASVGRLLTGCLSEEEASAGFKPGRFER